MSFDEKYQLLDLVEDAEAKVFLAKEISTGRQVTVFLFVGENARSQTALIEQLRTADRDQLPELVETGTNQGTPYIVTLPLSGFAALKTRAAQLKPASAPSPGRKSHEFSKAGVWHVPQLQEESRDSVKPPADNKGSQPAAGSFTQMFQAPATPSSETTIIFAPLSASGLQAATPGESTRTLPSPIAPAKEPVTVPPSPPTFSDQPPPQKQEQAPGEFTRMFQSPVAPFGESADVSTRPPAPANQPIAPPQKQEIAPGEFTQIFQAPKAPMGEPITPAIAPPPADSGPGEFTRFFQAAPPSSRPAPMPEKTGQGQFTKVFGGGVSDAKESAGQFTRIFEAQTPLGAPPHSAAGAPAPPPSYAPPAGAFTRVFGGHENEPAPPAPAEPQAPAGPGEYTRMFSAQTILPMEEPAPAPNEPAPSESSVPAKQTSKLPAILVGVILLLLVLIVILLAIILRK
jgi:hypothetical protein